MTIWELIALAKAGDGGAKSMLHFKGSVLNESALPESGNDGDTYLVDSADSYFAWDGEGWTDVGQLLSMDDVAALFDQVEDAGDAQVARIVAKGQEVEKSIPEDYSELSGEVDNLKSALNKLNVPYKSEHFQFSDTGSNQTNRTAYPLIEGNTYIIYNRSEDHSVTIRSDDGSATVKDFGSIGINNVKTIVVGLGEGGNLKTYGRAVNIEVDNIDYIYYQVAKTLKYEEQLLTDSQKTQSRKNIGAASATDVALFENDLKTLETKTIENVINELTWSKGAFESGGYSAISSNSYKYSQKLKAGVYKISTPNTLRWEAFLYDSNVSGTQIQDFTRTNKMITATGQFIITISPIDGGSLVGMDDEIAKFHATVINQNSIEARLSDFSEAQFCHPLLYQNTSLRIARMNNSITATNDTGLSTRAISIYAPTRILFKDDSLMVRINQYSTNLSFNGTLVETLRAYDYGCDYVVEGDSYPIYIAVGIKYNDDRSMTNTDLANASSKFSIRSLETQPEYADISMFQKFGVAGDSWTAGTIYNEADTIGVTRTEQSWAENLARQSGITCVNFALGGTSVRTWYNDQSTEAGLRGLLESDAVGLYILSMGGSNDWTSSANGGRGWELNPGEGESEDPTLYYYGTIEDITEHQDYHDYPLTFYGYYGRIIEQIMEHAPNSRIIITTPNTYPTNSDKCKFCYNATSEIAEQYGIPYMDLRKDAFFPVWANQNMLNGLHPLASTYSGMAKAVGRLFAKLVYDKWEYFRDYNGQLTTVPVTWQPLTK